MTTTAVQSVGGKVPQFGWGDRLRRVRKDAEMDQAQFASAIGLSKGAIGQHEMRDDLPQSARLMAHAVNAVFGVDAHWLLTGCECRAPEKCALLPRLDSNQQPVDCPLAAVIPIQTNRTHRTLAAFDIRDKWNEPDAA